MGAEPHALSALDARLLAFERRVFAQPGAKEQAIRDELGMSSVQYYVRLNELVDSPSALAHDPVLVGRLRRLREAGMRRRGH